MYVTRKMRMNTVKGGKFLGSLLDPNRLGDTQRSISAAREAVNHGDVEFQGQNSLSDTQLGHR